jgi:four helix bundle protein
MKMNNYKNLEIYQSAFNLAIQVYRLNVMLRVQDLLNQGTRLRSLSLRIKDMIAEGFSRYENKDDLIRSLSIIEKQNDEILILLRKIRKQNPMNKQLTELVKNYGKLKNKIESHIQQLANEESEYIIPFPESVMMEMAG